MKKIPLMMVAGALFLMASCNSETNNDPKEPTIGQRVDTTIQDVKSTTETAVNTIGDAADTTRNDIKHAAKDVRNGVKDALHDTKKALKKGAENADEKTKELENELKN